MPPTDRSSEPALLDQAVVERVLRAGLAGGGLRQEVFVEDRRRRRRCSTAAGRGELTSGRDRGAGIRVVVGDSTGFARHLGPCRRRAIAAAEAAAAIWGASGSTRWSTSTGSAPPPNAVGDSPRRRAPKARKVELLLTTGRAARTAGGRPRCRRAGRSPADPCRQQRRRARLRRPGRTIFSVSCVASGDTGMQTGRRSVSGHGRLRAVRTASRWRIWPSGGPAGAHQTGGARRAR